DIDSVNDVFTITFDDVQPFSGTQNNNAYQVRLWDLGSGDFGIEFRYEDLVWGRSGNTDYSTAGWSAGDQTNYGEIPGSGTSELENVESQSNIGQPGVFYFSINDINEISGTPNRDLLKGTASADQIDGLEDNDRLYGYDGNDILDGNDD
ncbi:MAG: nidogen-like domain-containing protein, partial [Coleofasciculus sp. C2-GNP5-27]